MFIIGLLAYAIAFYFLVLAGTRVMRQHHKEGRPFAEAMIAHALLPFAVLVLAIVLCCGAGPVVHPIAGLSMLLCAFVAWAITTLSWRQRYARFGSVPTRIVEFEG